MIESMVESLGDNCIVFHNHPSGNITPSEADKRITEKIKNALSFLDVSLTDHIISTKDSFYSFADNGEL